MRSSNAFIIFGLTAALLSAPIIELEHRGTQHEVCPEHGEPVHVKIDGARPQPVDQVTAPAGDDDDHTHGCCASTAPPRPAVTLVIATIAAFVRDVRNTGRHGAPATLGHREAPKQSPPS